MTQRMGMDVRKVISFFQLPKPIRQAGVNFFSPNSNIKKR